MTSNTGNWFSGSNGKSGSSSSSPSSSSPSSSTPPPSNTYTDAEGNVHMSEDYSKQGGGKYDTVVGNVNTPGQLQGGYGGSGFQKEAQATLAQPSVQKSIIESAKANPQEQQNLISAGLLQGVPSVPGEYRYHATPSSTEQQYAMVTQQNVDPMTGRLTGVNPFYQEAYRYNPETPQNQTEKPTFASGFQAGITGKVSEKQKGSLNINPTDLTLYSTKTRMDSASNYVVEKIQNSKGFINPPDSALFEAFRRDVGGRFAMGVARVPPIMVDLGVGIEILAKDRNLFVAAVPVGLGLMAGGLQKGFTENPVGTTSEMAGTAMGFSVVAGAGTKGYYKLSDYARTLDMKEIPESSIIQSEIISGEKSIPMTKAGATPNDVIESFYSQKYGLPDESIVSVQSKTLSQKMFGNIGEWIKEKLNIESKVPNMGQPTERNVFGDTREWLKTQLGREPSNPLPPPSESTMFGDTRTYLKDMMPEPSNPMPSPTLRDVFGRWKFTETAPISIAIVSSQPSLTEKMFGTKQGKGIPSKTTVEMPPFDSTLPRGYHAAPEDLGRDFTVTELPSEGDPMRGSGLHISPSEVGVSSHFLYLSKTSAPLFDRLFGENEPLTPSILRVTVSGGIKRIPSDIVEDIPASRKFITSDAEKGAAYLSSKLESRLARGLPAEPEAIIPAETKTVQTNERYYIKVSGRRVPIKEVSTIYDITGRSSQTSLTKLLGESDDFYNLGREGKPVFTSTSLEAGVGSSVADVTRPQYKTPVYSPLSNYTSSRYSLPKYQLPKYTTPSYVEPTYGTPTYVEPSYGTPLYTESTYNPPTYGNPLYDSPKYNNPLYPHPDIGNQGYPQYPPKQYLFADENKRRKKRKGDKTFRTPRPSPIFEGNPYKDIMPKSNRRTKTPSFGDGMKW